MPKDVSVSQALEFLKESRTRAEIREHFNLSNTQSWHLVKWLKKARLISSEERVFNGAIAEFHKAIENKE